MLSDKGCSYGWRWQAPEPGTQALENTTDKQFVKALAPSTQVLKITKSHIIWPNLGNFQQAIDIIFQVWEHAQKSKIFQPNKAYFLILLRIVSTFWIKIAFFMLYFCTLSIIKTNHMWQKVHFFLQISDNVKSSTKFSAILEFFSGTYVPVFPHFSMPWFSMKLSISGKIPTNTIWH